MNSIATARLPAVSKRSERLAPDGPPAECEMAAEDAQLAKNDEATFHTELPTWFADGLSLKVQGIPMSRGRRVHTDVIGQHTGNHASRVAVANLLLAACGPRFRARPGTRIQCKFP